MSLNIFYIITSGFLSEFFPSEFKRHLSAFSYSFYLNYSSFRLDSLGAIKIK